MKKIFLSFFLFCNIAMMTGFSQDCGIRFILLNDDSIVVALPFLQYALWDSGNKCKISVEYPPTFNEKKTGFIKWERQIRVKDSIGYVKLKTGRHFVDFHISGTRYLINKEWIESVEPVAGGDHALIAGRFRGRKFTSDETYEYIISQLFECPWPNASGDSLEVCADNGLNVDIGTGCVEIGGTMIKNSIVNLNAKSLKFTGNRFGEGLSMDDNISSYILGTGTGSTTEDAYIHNYRDISGFGRMTLAAYQILIGVPAGNGYHLPNTRPGNSPETFPYYAKWYPVWTRSGSGTGSIAGWELIEQDRKGIFTGTVDGSGDALVPIPSVMPDASYVVLVTPESSTPYAVAVHTKTDASFKVATGLPPGTSVILSWRVEDN
jgi:hypothetical protein